MGRLIRWLLGWVTVELSGPYPERWFNLCAVHSLPFWDAAPQNAQCARFTLPRYRLAQAKQLAEQSLSRLQVVEEGGLPAFLLRFRLRTGMIAGAILFFLLFTVLSRFIMVIDVEGNVTVSDASVIALLQRCGFGIGSYGPGVDVRELSNRALMQAQELAFLTVDISGIRARVVVREADPVPEITDDSVPSDIVAARDGWIVDLDVIAGQAELAQGDGVLKGEVIISHLLRNLKRDGSGEVVSTQSVRSKGQVWAVTKHTLSAALPLSALSPGGERDTGYAGRLFNRRVNFYGNSSQRDRECAKIAILIPLRLPDGTALPFGLWRSQWQAWAGESALSPQAGAQFLKDILRTRLETALDGGEILSADWSVEERKGAVVVTLDARCLEQIGVEAPLSTP